MNPQMPSKPFWIAYALLPMAIIAATIVGIIAFVFPELPDQIATHWDFSGNPDDFSSPASMLLIGGLALGIPTLIIAISAAKTRFNSLGRCAIILAVFFAALQIDVFVPQMGLQTDEVPEASLGSWLGPVVMIAGYALALGVSAIMRKLAQDYQAKHTPSVSSEEPIQQWNIPAGKMGKIYPALCIILFLALIVPWPTLAIFLLTLLFSIGFNPSATTKLYRDAIVFESMQQMIVLPLEHIRRIETKEHIGFWDAGGWGLRFDGDNYYIMPRSGEAIIITTEDNTKITSVVPDNRSQEILDMVKERIE